MRQRLRGALATIAPTRRSNVWVCVAALVCRGTNGIGFDVTKRRGLL